jgi:amidohydrolase
MSTSNELLASARAIAGQIVADRRTIHQQPELAYHEQKTAALVVERLSALGIEARTGVGQTGVVAVIEGTHPGKTVLLRADMDALPMQELNDFSYASQTPGVMHACGHDGHTAILLGAARLLVERRESLHGRVKLMFQPAEEGGAGALRMIEDGLLENPSVDAAFALHVYGQYRTGQVGVTAGPTWASSDRFTILVNGRGGHASRPNLTVDPVVIAAQIVVALQTLVSREIPPDEEAVVTVGSIDAGTTFNVIPDTARIRGTVRTYSDDVQALLERRIAELASGIAQAMRGDAQTDYVRLYPALINHASGAEVVRSAIRNVLGAEHLMADTPQMGSEDFAFVLQRVPGAMFRLGVQHPSWTEARTTHSSSFDLDEDALPVGAAVMAATALKFLDG